MYFGKFSVIPEVTETVFIFLAFFPHLLSASWFFLNVVLFLAMLGLHCWTVEISLVEVRGGSSSLQGARFSLRGLPWMWNPGSRALGFGGCRTWAHLSCVRALQTMQGPRCSEACGIFPDQGWSLCLLNWQADF